ncbi:MAG TPA: nucleotide exchange factor GrpE [Candidatus Paceibacterota bacterium]
MNMNEDNIKELEQIKQEREEYLNGWKRAKADFVNYQKDEAKRREELVKFSNEYLIRDLLPIVDSLEMYLAMTADSKEKKGVEMIYAQLVGELTKQGMEPIKALGELFDPALHEALGEMEAEQPSGTVAAELERGWKLNGKVIRPTRVKVAK